MRQYLNFALACFAALLLLAAWLVSAGCTSEPSAYAEWRDEYAAPWDAVVACYECEPPRPAVTVRADCILGSGGVMYYPAVYSPTGYATGEFSRPDRVTVCSDLKALKHEFSHYVSYRATGHDGIHGGGCWL